VPVLVDLAKPPTGSITPFAAYVALSRGRGRDSIRLLRDFEDKLFTTHPSEYLRKEKIRLESLSCKPEKRSKCQAPNQEEFDKAKGFIRCLCTSHKIPMISNSDLRLQARAKRQVDGERGGVLNSHVARLPQQ